MESPLRKDGVAWENGTEGHVHVGPTGEAEPVWKNAHDGVRPVIQPNRRAYRAPIATECLMPERIRQDCHARAARLSLFG